MPSRISRPAAPELQRDPVLLRMRMQDAQVELHEVPADHRIGIVFVEPFVEPREHRWPAVAVVEAEVDGICFVAVCSVRRTEHVDLPLPAAFERDRIQLAVHARFDVERHAAQRRAIAGRGFQLGAGQRAVAIGLPAKLHAGRDEALHRVAVGRLHVGFIDVDAGGRQALLQPGQMAIALAIEADDRALPEVAQRERAQLGFALACQRAFGKRLLLGRDERDGFLRAQPHAARTVFGCQPELDLDAGCGVPPVAGKDEALLERRQNACSSWMPRRRILALGRGERPEWGVSCCALYGV